MLSFLGAGLVFGKLEERRMKKRWLQILIGLVVFALLLLLLLPSMLFSKPVKNWILNDVLPKHGIDAEIDSVSVGWFRQTRIQGTSIGPSNKRAILQADEIRVDRTLLSALFASKDLGELTIQHPQIHVWIDEDSSNLKFEKLEQAIKGRETSNDLAGEESTSGDLERTLKVRVEGAELYLKTPSMQNESNVFRNLDVRCELASGSSGRKLLVEPGPIIKRGSITPELCEGGLKYLVPVLANATWTKGEFSLDLDACTIDLDSPEQSTISGKLTIHGVEAGIKNELIDSVADRVSTLVGGTGFDSVHLADNTVVQFQIRDGMVWHEGVEFGLPRVSEDLVIRTSGSVSFDEQLDLTIDIPLPLHLIASGPLSRALREKVVSLHATGPLEKPEVKLKDEDLVTDLLGSIVGELSKEEQPVQSVFRGIREAIRGDGDEPIKRATPMLDRLRDRIRNRRGQ